MATLSVAEYCWLTTCNNSRAHLKHDGTRAETRFCLSEIWTNPFKSAGESVQSTTGSRGVRISGRTMDRPCSEVQCKSSGYPLQSPISPSLPLPYITVCHHISNASTKKKAFLFPWLQWLCNMLLHYIICTVFLIFQVHILSDTLLQKFCTLHTSPPSHSHAGSIAASLNLLFNNIGKLHREIFEEHCTSW